MYLHLVFFVSLASRLCSEVGMRALRRRCAQLPLALALALCSVALARPRCRLAVIGAGTPRTGSTHEMKARAYTLLCCMPH